MGEGAVGKSRPVGQVKLAAQKAEEAAVALPKEAQLKAKLKSIVSDGGNGRSFPEAGLAKDLFRFLDGNFKLSTTEGFDEAVATLRSAFSVNWKDSKLSDGQKAQVDRAITDAIANLKAPSNSGGAALNKTALTIELRGILAKSESMGQMLKGTSEFLKKFEPMTYEKYQVAIEILRSGFAINNPAAKGMQASWADQVITQTIQELKAPPLPPGLKAGAAGKLVMDQEVVCPVLGSMINSGVLTLREDGTVSLAELRAKLADPQALSSTEPIGKVLSFAGQYLANPPQDILHNILGDEINVMKLREGSITHAADSGVLNNEGKKFNEENFKHLVSFAKHGRMGRSEFAEAIAANVVQDVDQGGATAVDAMTRGMTFSLAEFAGLLAVFGQGNPPSISVADLRAMYQDKKLPPVDTQKAGFLNNNGVAEAVKIQAMMTMEASVALSKRLMRAPEGTRAGLAAASAELAVNGKALNETASAATVALSAGKAANCPYLTGGAGASTASPDLTAMVAAHAKNNA